MNTSDYIKKPKGYWDNYDNCKNECRKYRNLKELKANSSGCYYALIRNKWKDEFYPDRIKIKSKWENKENCIAKAKRYNDYATFVRLAYDCYLSMKENGWLDEVFKHCPDYEALKYWNNYEHCKEECEKYNTIRELRRNNSKCYNSIIRNGWKNDFFNIEYKEVKNFGFWNNKSHCIEEAKKYYSMNELKDKSNGCYASVLKHGWENDCYPDFKKRKPNGYWNNKEVCFAEAKKYRNLKEFQLKCYGAYYCAIKNGWKDEINKLYDKTILYHSYNEKIHLVYLYLFVDYNTFYVGRTNNLKRRNQQHIRDHNDSIFKFCNDKGIEIPPYVILKEDLTATESQFYEDFYLKEYIIPFSNIDIPKESSLRYMSYLGCGEILVGAKLEELLIENYKDILPKNNLKEYIIELVPEMNKVFDIWNNSQLYCFDLTSVGMTIGNANMKFKTGINIDLSVWI